MFFFLYRNYITINKLKVFVMINTINLIQINNKLFYSLLNYSSLIRIDKSLIINSFELIFIKIFLS